MWNSRNLKWWPHIFNILYITHLSYKRKLHNPQASAIRMGKTWNRNCSLRVEFLLKTDSVYPRDAEVTLFTLAHPEHSLRFRFFFLGCRRPNLLPNAGSRTDFWGKNQAIFSGELFLGEGTSFSGKKCRSILSNQVISWNGSRADFCPLGREFSAKTYSLLGGFLLSRHLAAKEEFFFPWKRKKPKRRWGIYESTPQPITVNRVVDK